MGKEEYAALLAKQALKYGELARDDARKAAKAGKLAAAKAPESANVKAELGGAKGKKTSTKTVTEALQRENIAADLAAKAAKMEDAIVTGGHSPDRCTHSCCGGECGSGDKRGFPQLRQPQKVLEEALQEDLQEEDGELEGPLKA